MNVEKIIIGLNNDQTSERNRGLEASIKNYLKLLNYYNPEKISICLPNKKDFGDMNDSDFKSWDNKCSSIEPSVQQNFILEKIKKYIKHYQRLY